MGGAQDEGDAAASAASWLPHRDFFVFPLKMACQRSAPRHKSGPPATGRTGSPEILVGLWVNSMQRMLGILLALPLFFSVNCDIK